MNQKQRKVLQFDRTAAGMKGLEAVLETQGDTTNAYYQVVHVGEEVLQTISREKAQERYDLLR